MAASTLFTGRGWLANALVYALLAALSPLIAITFLVILTFIVLPALPVVVTVILTTVLVRCIRKRMKSSEHAEVVLTSPSIDNRRASFVLPDPTPPGFPTVDDSTYDMEGSDCSDESSSIWSDESDIDIDAVRQKMAELGEKWYEAQKSWSNNQLVNTEHVFTGLEAIDEEEEE